MNRQEEGTMSEGWERVQLRGFNAECQHQHTLGSQETDRGVDAPRYPLLYDICSYLAVGMSWLISSGVSGGGFSIRGPVHPSKHEPPKPESVKRGTATAPKGGVWYEMRMKRVLKWSLAFAWSMV